MAVCLSSDVWWSGGDGANVPLGGVNDAVGWRRRRALEAWRGQWWPWLHVVCARNGVKGISCGPVQVFSECRQVGLQ